MTPEKRATLAKGLANNPLWRELFEARAADIHDTWENEVDADKREQCWNELHTLRELRDFINAKLNEYRRGAD